MAAITWTGGSLSNRNAGTWADRFTGWEPRSLVVGPRHALLADGAMRREKRRTDHGARFTLAEIPAASMAAMLALQEHLDGGGVVTVVCDDTTGATYAGCCLAPGAEAPAITLDDPQQLLYAMAFDLIQPGAASGLVCVYP